jgi:D-glycero-D-manno-heptose 1,7-bisphosphate phosphatase
MANSHQTQGGLHSASRQPAVFLDRDGVLIENIDGDYVRSISQIEVLPGAKEAINKLSKAGFPLIIVTNQAAVAKGYITNDEAWTIQHEVESLVGKSNQSLHSIICPHASTDGCDCRKPKAGMLLEGAEKYHLDLGSSYFIGDALTDIAAAKAAGVQSIFVFTGRGESEYAKSTKKRNTL